MMKNVSKGNYSLHDIIELNCITYSKTPPPPLDSVYADPNCIEHEATPVGTEYAMVDRKVKEKKHNKNKPPQPEPSLYQVLYFVCLLSYLMVNLTLGV